MRGGCDAMQTRILKRIKAAIPLRVKEGLFGAWAMCRFGRLGWYIVQSRQIFNWRQRSETVALARYSYSLATGATIVEVGSFVGSSAILLAGARKLRGTGKVHCVDTFDVSVDIPAYSILKEILDRNPHSHRNQFENNIRTAKVSDWVTVHQGSAQAVARYREGPTSLVVTDVQPAY